MRSKLLRPFTVPLGLVFLALGVVGAFLPLMPSTVFFIVAAGSFAYASPRLEAWLLSVDFIGKPVRAWRERGAIARGAKIMATLGMAAGLAIYAATGAGPLAIATTAGMLALCVLFIWSRPTD